MYGAGDGVTTFAVPDLRSRVIRGVGSRGSTSTSLGQKGGTDGVTLGASNLPPHAGHMLTTTSVKTSLLPSGVGSQATCGTSDNYVLSMDGATSTCSGAACSESVGSGDPFDVTSPYLVVNYIIAVEGLWPVRP